MAEAPREEVIISSSTLSELGPKRKKKRKKFKTSYKFLYVPLSHLNFKAHKVCNTEAVTNRKADLTGDIVRSAFSKLGITIYL